MILREYDARNTTDDDPGNIRDLIDETVSIHSDHLAFDGDPHITPDDVERHAADKMARDRIADVDESSQPAQQIAEDHPDFLDYVELISWAVPTEIILKLPHDYIGWGGYPVWRRDEIENLLSIAGKQVQP